MLDKLYITPRQWGHIFRWTMYFLLVLAAILLQTVIFGNGGMFGQRPDLVALVIISVCFREGPERGGLFALLSSTFWALSGIDQGALQILCLTALPLLGSLLCRKVFAASYMASLTVCIFTLLVSQSVGFLLKMFYEAAPGSLYFTRLLPGILVSLLFQPLIYWLVKCIEKIGEPYEAT